MIRNLARAVVVLAILLLAFLNPAWGLFVIIGLTIRITWSNRHTPVVKSIAYFVASLVAGVLGAVTGIFVFLILLLVIAFLLNSCGGRGPTYESVEYKAHIEFIATSNSFSVKDEIIVPVEERINSILLLSRMRESMHEKPVSNLEELMASKGWGNAGVIDGKRIYTRRREQKALCGWFSSYTVNDISIPRISHADIILVPNGQSHALLDVPKHLIVSTFPSSTPQSTLKGDKEQFLINVPSPSSSHSNWELGVVHPALRNEVGISFIKTSIWTPVYWTVAALLLIFSKQIELGILMPFVRGLFEILGVKYRKEDETPNGSAKSDEGKKRTNQANPKGRLNRRLKG